MRKAISLLLALSMIFALCGCGGGGSASAKQDDFTVEDFEIEKYDSERMYFKVKVRNNTDTDVADFTLAYQLLDENGDSVYDYLFGASNILAGQACWLGSYSIEYKDYKDAVLIRFVSYYTDKSSKNILFNQKAEFSLVNSTAGEDGVISAGSQESGQISIDAICADDSYRDGDNSPLRKVYLFYTLTPGNTNLSIDSKTYVKVNNANEYQSSSDSEAMKYIKNYYNSVNLETVYVGTSQKVLACFTIPEGDLTAGKALTFRDSQIPAIENIHLTTDDIQHFNGIEEIAAAVDPEGYKEKIYLREEADADLTQKVVNAVSGMRYSCSISYYVSSIRYSIEFSSDKRFTVETSFSGTGGDGTYSVRNGYIFCTYDSTGYTIEIPYNFNDDGSIYLDVIYAFDAMK